MKAGAKKGWNETFVEGMHESDVNGGCNSKMDVHYSRDCGHKTATAVKDVKKIKAVG